MNMDVQSKEMITVGSNEMRNRWVFVIAVWVALVIVWVYAPAAVDVCFDNINN